MSTYLKILIILIYFFSFELFADTPSKKNEKLIPTPGALLKKTILVKDNHFSLDLPSNPTTGYSWFLGDYDYELISRIKKSYTPNKNNGMAGSGGTEHWDFKLKTQTFRVPTILTIEMIYARPWSLDDAKSEIFKIVVISD